jgi:hypothetical protein
LPLAVSYATFYSTSTNRHPFVAYLQKLVSKDINDDFGIFFTSRKCFCWTRKTVFKVAKLFAKTSARLQETAAHEGLYCTCLGQLGHATQIEMIYQKLYVYQTQN